MAEIFDCARLDYTFSNKLQILFASRSFRSLTAATQAKRAPTETTIAERSLWRAVTSTGETITPKKPFGTCGRRLRNDVFTVVCSRKGGIARIIGHWEEVSRMQYVDRKLTISNQTAGSNGKNL